MSRAFKTASLVATVFLATTATAISGEAARQPALHETATRLFGTFEFTGTEHDGTSVVSRLLAISPCRDEAVLDWAEEAPTPDGADAAPLRRYVKIVRLDSFRAVAKIALGDDEAAGVVFSPDCSKAIVPAGDDLKAFDTDTWSAVWTVKSDWTVTSDSTQKFAFSPDGRTIYGASSPLLEAFDASSGAKLWGTATHSMNDVYALAVSADGKRLAGGAAGGVLHLWSARNGASLRRFRAPGKTEAHHGNINGVVFGASGDALVTAGGDGSIRFWDTRSGELQHVVPCDAGASALLREPGDAAVIDVACGRQIWRLDARNGRLLSELPESDDLIASMGSAGRGIVWTEEIDGALVFWDVRRGIDINQRFDVSNATLTGDGSRLAIVGWGSSTIELLAPTNLETQGHLAGFVSPLLDRGPGAGKARMVAADPGGRYVAAGGYTTDGYVDHHGVDEGVLLLWRLGVAIPIARWPGVAPDEIAFSPDGKHMLARSPALSDTPHTIWSIAGNTAHAKTWDDQSSRFRGCQSDFHHAVPFYSASRVPELAVRFVSCTGPPLGLETVDPATERPLARLTAAIGADEVPVLTRDRRSVVSCSEHGVREWDATSGRSIVVVPPSPAEGCSAISVAGKRLAALSVDTNAHPRTYTLAVYDLATMRLIGRRKNVAFSEYDGGDFVTMLMAGDGRHLDVVLSDRVDAWALVP